MKSNFYVKFLGLALIFLAIILAKLAYDHRGFFVYKYSILTSKKYASYQEELLELVRNDPPKAFDRYREIFREDPFSYNTCHGIAHQMGHEAFVEFGFQRAMEYQDALCGAGYIHGVIEARFGLLGEDDILRELPTLCNEMDSSCYHGLGHGLMVVTKLNVQNSLSYCDRLSKVGARNCYDGVWMHIFDLEESGAVHDSFDASILPDTNLVVQRIALCDNAEDAYMTSCYFYLPRIYAHANEADVSHFQTLCEGVKKSGMWTCVAGVGHTMMKYHIADPQTVLDRCAAFKTAEQISACKEGAFRYYLFAANSLFDFAESCDGFADERDKALCIKVEQYNENF